ncbi:hypothetical protein [Synechococcus sp. M16CYN]|uniref:hypothetical protein n=1 Tax=Synechococcus sp. M16CYN TaxID=3103139 RepID=UPI00333F90A6
MNQATGDALCSPIGSDGLDRTIRLRSDFRIFRFCEEAVRSYRAGNSRFDRDRDSVPYKILCGKNRNKDAMKAFPNTGFRDLLCD